jgi:hypothetical protein
MKLWYNLMLWTILLNLSVYLLQVFGVVNFVGVNVGFDVERFSEMFTLDWFIRSFTYAAVGVAGIGLATLLLRLNLNPIYAMAVWSVGVFIPIISDFLLAVPNMINALIPEAMNPIAPAPNPFSIVFGGIFAFGAFMFLMERINNQQIT